MRTLITLLGLGTILAISDSKLLNAQPAGTNQTVQATEPGELAEPVWFEWKSGRGDWTLSRFLEQIKTNFGFDLRASADIPEQMLHARVPSMKIKASSVWDVLLLYNQVSNDYPEIGRWIMVRSPSDARFYVNKPLNAIFLVPPKQTDQEDALSVRAFTLRDIPDLEQNQLFTMIKVARKFRVFDHEAALWAWLSQIARNALFDYIREQSRLPKPVSIELLGSTVNSAEAVEAELLEWLERGLNDLDEEERALVDSIYFERRRQRDVAGESGTTQKAIESKMARIRAKLRQFVLQRIKNERRTT